MGKLIVTNIMSLDGFVEGPGGNVMALPMDAAFDDYCAERLRAADALLLGRVTYMAFKGFWPAMADNPDASPVHREIGQRDNKLDKTVVSDSLTADDTDPWRDTTTIVGRADAAARVAELKATTDGEILMFGSHILWNSLLAAGLVDELHIILGAVALGGGTPAFDDGTPPTNLTLADTRRWDGSDNLLLVYRT